MSEKIMFVVHSSNLGTFSSFKSRKTRRTNKSGFSFTPRGTDKSHFSYNPLNLTWNINSRDLNFLTSFIHLQYRKAKRQISSLSHGDVSNLPWFLWPRALPPHPAFPSHPGWGQRDELRWLHRCGFSLVDQVNDGHRVQHNINSDRVSCDSGKTSCSFLTRTSLSNINRQKHSVIYYNEAIK